MFPPEVPKEPSSCDISLLTLVRSRWPYSSWKVPIQFDHLESIPVLHQALKFSNFQCDSEFRHDAESAALVYTYTCGTFGTYSTQILCLFSCISSISTV